MPQDVLSLEGSVLGNMHAALHLHRRPEHQIPAE